MSLVGAADRHLVRARPTARRNRMHFTPAGLPKKHGGVGQRRKPNEGPHGRGFRDVQAAVSNWVMAVASAWATLCCQEAVTTRAASLALRMLAHSTRTFGTVVRLIPARSLRGWIPSTPA